MTGENGKVQTLVKTSTVSLPVNGQDEASANVIEAALDMAYPEYKVKLESKDLVGSQIGSELKKDATWSIIISLICIIIYVSFRFQFGFALGGVVALAHDALITLGIYTFCGNQVSLTTVAALLTIVGYSINDTIVVFDRIREDLRKNNKLTFVELCNNSLNSCLSRTVITSLTTLFAVLALFAFGDGSIFDFAFTMLLGIIAGTYSTMFIATPIMMWFYKNRRPEFKDEDSSED
jgi:preprotein translocase subunit SecF